MVIALAGLGVTAYVLLNPESIYSLDSAFAPLNDQANQLPNNFNIPQDIPKDTPPDPITPPPSPIGIRIIEAQIHVGGPSHLTIENIGNEPLMVHTIALGEEWVWTEEFYLPGRDRDKITLPNVTGTAGSAYLLQINGTTTTTKEQVSAQASIKLQDPVETSEALPPDSTVIYHYYADPIPSYAKEYARDAVSEATAAWESKNPNVKFYPTSSPQEADFYIQWVRDYGQQHVGWAYGSMLQIGLGDSACKDQWAPFSAVTLRQIVTHEIGHYLGLGHSPNINNVMYESTKLTYGQITEELTTSEYYRHFTGLCSRDQVTTYTIELTTSSPSERFDVYFVPSSESYYEAMKGESFTYFSDKGCFGKGQLSFEGTCENVPIGAGLLIINHQESRSLEKFTIRITPLDVERNYDIPLIPER